MAHPEAHPFGQRMAALRHEHGLSQAELGRRLGISRGMVAYFGNNGSNGSPKKKPGPVSRLAQLTEELSRLPKSKQRVVVEMLEGFLNQATKS